jgi:hypothetical protein
VEFPECYIEESMRVWGTSRENAIWNLRRIAEEEAKDWGVYQNTPSSNYNYGSNWAKANKEAKNRDKYICQRCGKNTDRLEVHHIKPSKEFKVKEEGNSLENLITYCHKCHREVEAEAKRKLKKSF